MLANHSELVGQLIVTNCELHKEGLKGNRNQKVEKNSRYKIKAWADQN